MFELRQGPTDKVIPFLLVSAANHIDGATGLTPTVQISRNGGAFAAPAGTVAEIAHGWYKLTPAAADTNTPGALVLHAEASGADPTDQQVLVVAVDPYDSSAMGLSSVASMNGRLPANPAAVGSAMTLDLSQAVPLANAAQSLGDALNAARAAGFGGWTLVGTTLTLFGPDGVTPVRTFTLTDPNNPTARN